MRWLCIKIVIVVVFVIFACNVSMYPKKPIVTYTHEKFDMSSYNEDCPIEISSTMYENEYHNSIVVTINNKTDAVISAVKFLFSCKNVYGEVVSNKKYIYDRKIDNRPCKTEALILAKKIKMAEIRVYSVYYYNNCKAEWGDHKIRCVEIIKNLPIIATCEV